MATLPSFADLPDGPIPDHLESGPPSMESRIAQPDPPEGSSGSAPSGGTQYVPIPVPVVPPQASRVESDANFFRNLAMYEAEKERRQFQYQQDEAWRRSQTPPPLPDDPEELLTDGKKFRDVLAQRDQFYMNAIQMNVQPMAERLGQMEQELVEARVSRADVALRDARGELARRGIPEDGRIWGEVERVLQNDPQNYWKLRSSPEAMFTAYNVVAQNVGGAQPGRPQMQAPNAPTAGGNAQAPGRQGPALKDDTLLRIERQLGVKFNDQDTRAYQRAVGRR